MEFDINHRPSLEVQINIKGEDSPRIIKVMLGTPSIYRAMTDGLQSLACVTEQGEEDVQASETDLDRGRNVFATLSKQGEVCIDTLKKVLTPEEWANIEDVIEYLPLESVRELLWSVFNAMSEALVTDLGRGKL